MTRLACLRGGGGGSFDDYYASVCSSDDEGESSDSDVEGETKEDEEHDSEDEEEDKAEKRNASTKKAAPRQRSRGNLLFRACQSHENKIIFTLSLLFFFRRPLLDLLSVCKTRVASWDFTTLLFRVALLVLVIQYMRQMANRKNDGSSSSSLSEQQQQQLYLLALLLSQFAGVPPVFVLLLKFLNAPTNTAYVPPVRQHYSFELYNQRYSKDAKALEKILNVPSVGNITIQTNNNDSSDKDMLNATVPLLSKFIKSVLPKASSDAAAAAETKQLQSTKSKSDGESSSAQNNNPVVIVLEMTKLDTSLSQLDSIRDKISFLLSQHRRRAMTTWDATLLSNNNVTLQGTSSNDEAQSSLDATTVNATNATNAVAASSNTTATLQLSKTVLPLEVVVVLESSGGSASEYALAAQQLLRLRREPGITLTIVVDKVAASGGYMMACTAEKLLAAPFAVLGSIGVVGQTLNFYETLQNYGVEPLTFRSGRAKAPLSATDKITREGMAVVQSMLDNVHHAFQAHVAQSRPTLAENIENIATGETWLGCDALQHGLIDGVMSR